ncbi:MAG: hypothetical protein ABSB23_07740 [Bryobacteraceae bacterium]
MLAALALRQLAAALVLRQPAAARAQKAVQWDAATRVPASALAA